MLLRKAFVNLHLLFEFAILVLSSKSLKNMSFLSFCLNLSLLPFRYRHKDSKSFRNLFRKVCSMARGPTAICSLRISFNLGNIDDGP